VALLLAEEIIVKPDKFPFAVYTQDRTDKGMRPFVVWGTSQASVRRAWWNKYKLPAVKVVRMSWDVDSSNYKEEQPE